MTWEPVERKVQFWSEFCFNRFSGSAMKWPRSSSACGAGRWNLFLRSSFPHGPPSPPPPLPATRVAVPPGLNMPLDPPIAPSNYSPLAHQGISWVGSKWDIFGWKIVRLSGGTSAAWSVENLSATTTRGRLRYKSIHLNLVDASHVILRKSQSLQKNFCKIKIW